VGAQLWISWRKLPAYFPIARRTQWHHINIIYVAKRWLTVGAQLEISWCKFTVYLPIPGSGNFLVRVLSVCWARALCDLLRNMFSINTSGLSDSGSTNKNPDQGRLPKFNYASQHFPYLIIAMTIEWARLGSLMINSNWTSNNYSATDSWHLFRSQSHLNMHSW
jgi:hypothetical protein